MNTFKPYVELECNNIALISSKIYNFLKEETELLSTNAIGWQFVDCKKILNYVPELVTFFKNHKLLPRDAAVVILTENGQLPLHIDELPVVAKINFPVVNTVGWVNRWYSISDEDLANCPRTTNQFGKSVEQLSQVPIDQFTLVAELPDLATPIVFNSRIPHVIDKISATPAPRIVASFTFHNEPIGLLK
jgi:hypothetical protein